MTPLPSLENPRLLLSFDFDGTLHEPREGWPLTSDFFDYIKYLREERDALWLLNTGRSLFQTIQGFNEIKFPFLPDYVIVREREIYVPGSFGRWHPMGRWNFDCEKAHKKLFRKSKRVFKKLKTYVEKETQARWIEEEHEPAGVIASSMDEMTAIAEYATQLCAKGTDLSFERNDIYMRFSHKNYNKGTSLVALGEALGLGAESRFVVGDGHNDLNKLLPEVASFIACPSNAVADVKQQVQDGKGYIASQPASAGTLEALKHFFPAEVAGAVK